MKKLIILVTILALVAILWTGCKDSQYVIKKSDKNLKYKYATNWYQKGNYFQAIPVIENLLPLYKGTDTSELLYYMLAESYFLNKEYMVSAYHFKTFKELYPRSYKAEVASYRTATCYNKALTYIELEQSSTYKAMDYYKAFISEYPKSPMVDEANSELDKLQKRLEDKAISAADLYYKTSNFRAAATTYRNVLNEFPTIKGYESIYFKICNSYYKFAEHSLVTKQAERYEKALEACNSMLNRFPNTKYKDDINKLAYNSKVNILESAYENANQYYNLDEREIYYSQALDLYNEFAPDITPIPSKLNHYTDKCRLGVIRTYSALFDNERDKTKQIAYYHKLTNYYLVNESKFDQKSAEFAKAKQLYNLAVNQFKNS